MRRFCPAQPKQFGIFFQMIELQSFETVRKPAVGQRCVTSTGIAK
jgi:hypothetical protein